ncbi:MAG TPA: hypothetical protein VF339_18935 [Gammaproteobacteria bacterium]
MSQVALSTLLASAGCLLALSFYNLTAQPLGFRPDGLLTFRVQLPAQDYPDQASRTVLQRALVAALAELPGVDAAATTSAAPLGTIAVGAPPRALLASVCGAGVRLAAVGILAGTLGSFALVRFVRALLYSVAPVEPLVSLAVAGFMLLLAVAAAALPAWASSRISPTLAIRNV